MVALMEDILNMAGLELLRARLPYVPSLPGVYLMRDASGAVIYVGKAKCLRRRLRDYLVNRSRDPKVDVLVGEMKDFEVHITKLEKDALLLEERLITDFLPKYNLAQRQGRTRYWISVVVQGQLPRLEITREFGGPKSQCRGPYPSFAVAAWMVRFLNRLYGLRSCSPRFPSADDFRHCLEHVTNHCCAPCIGRVSSDEYQVRVERAGGWLDQPSWKIAGILKDHMRRLAETRQYERAAKCRDVIRALGSPSAKLPPKGLRVSKDLARMQIEDLTNALDLPDLPRSMEAFDISHLGGTGNVASLVCFANGLPDRKNYRYFRLSVEGPNDVECMSEAVMRRYRDRPAPDLIVIDGGLPQLGAALAALRRVGVESAEVIALAKERETIFRADGSCLQLELSRPALHLVQRIRDEAHRTANGYTRRMTRRRMSLTSIDRIPGVGPDLARRLLAEFGSPARVRQASEVQLRQVKGVGNALAKKIRAST